MAATSLAKRVGATILLVAEFLVLVAGLILHVPEAIKKVLEDAPTWMKDPTVWWIAVNAVVTLIVLYCIWRIPSERDDATRWAWDTSLQCGRLMSLFRELMDFRKMMVERIGESMNSKFVFDELEILLPPRIKELLGEHVHDEFVLRVVSAKKRSKTDPYIT